MIGRSDFTARIGACVAGFLAAAAISGVAQAQTMNANSASFNAGYGRYSGEENQPVNVSMSDANGNTTIVNGEVTSAQGGSIFANSTGINASASAGAFDNFSGAGGSSSATAIGNNLNVVTEGDNNTVIVTSVQSNSGPITATANGNGN